MTVRDTPVPQVFPGVQLDEEEDDTFVTLIWTGVRGAVVPNGGGVGTTHETRCTRGQVRFAFADGRGDLVLGAGQVILLPVNVGYEVTVESEDAEVRCFYPKAVPGAVEEILHLRERNVEESDAVEERSAFPPDRKRKV